MHASVFLTNQNCVTVNKNEEKDLFAVPSSASGHVTADKFTGKLTVAQGTA